MEIAQHTRAVCFFFFVSFLEDVLKELFHINAANGGVSPPTRRMPGALFFKRRNLFFMLDQGLKSDFTFGDNEQ